MSVPQPLNVRRYEGGPRQVMAFHCTMAHSGAWRGVAAALSDLATIDAPDMLNHGSSPDWDGQGEVEDRIVAASAAALPEGPVDLIGHSFGGKIALRLAVAYPGRVRSLTLIEPVMFSVAAADAPELAQADATQMQPVFDALKANDDALAARLFNRLWGAQDGPRWPDLPEATRASMTRAVRIMEPARAAIYEDRAGLLAPGVLDGATMPVLILHGARSPEVMRTICEGLARRLPDARATAVQGGDHMLPITLPKEVAATIRAFWDTWAPV
ncbi:Pimeloyl-ACP methyl ester carboxylesterase [Cribrihabitans marinus]|uniref:Pimeloyl-ACP methyl ester carboxylesterase n=1 Tax=Cribrihabitans marinus TaxID=1227549 RepID=A0A1H7AS69_9RHOB|nr:alpha/beta hydrolase [Cribrihabitans marinus]GGH31723.1 lipase LipV [Cribrihabitans marinus]SEJ64710.1 Pimeloyl-ACP methyl ester carboxylesterase [Cribrihabitans marinus]